MRDYSFGNFLHELRLRRGLTQYQLGALVGVSDKAVSKWENGASKPQSNILYKLSEVLGISVDELLTCKYHSLANKETKGVFAMKKQLWDKAFDAMSKHYGNPVPIEIANRFLTEQAEMKDTDMIVYLDFLSILVANAKKQREHIHLRGWVGSSFVAYLLGATEINPLKPHYYCSDCKTVEFDDSVGNGWDLPIRRCSCGKQMKSDGHNLPFVPYRHFVHHNIGFDVAMSPKFWNTARSIIEDYFKDCKLTFIEREEKSIATFTVTSKNSKCPFAFFAVEEYELYQALENATATSFFTVPFFQKDILREFQNGNTDGISEFESIFMKNMISQVNPTSFHDLINILGLSHSAGAWLENGDKLMEKGLSFDKIISYRDDVFNYIQGKMIAKDFTDTGFACEIMEYTRKGLYANNGGLPDNIRAQLSSIGAEDFFIDAIGKIKYLYPKAHGVTYMKLAATLMWYKVHYPKEFNEIML